MKRWVFLLWLLMASIASATPMVPNGSLLVSYHQKQDGKLSDGVHQIELVCADGQCYLDTLTFNQCFKISKGEHYFHPIIERVSTDDGTLRIISVEDNSLSFESKQGGARFLYRFGFKVRNEPELAKALKLKTDRYFAGITSFGGSAMKDSAIVEKVLSWELVPLKGTWVTVKADCDIRLAGVPE